MVAHQNTPYTIYYILGVCCSGRCGAAAVSIDDHFREVTNMIKPPAYTRQGATIQYEHLRNYCGIYVASSYPFNVVYHFSP